MNPKEKQFVLEKINKFKRKYFTDLLIQGGVFFIGLSLSIILLLSFIEYLGHFNETIRGALFILFVGTVAVSFYRWVFSLLLKVIYVQRFLSDEDASKKIGNYFPQVNDQLLNALQLNANNHNSELLEASIEQKFKALSPFDFSSAIDIKARIKSLRLYFIPSILFFLLLLITPALFTEGTTRLINFNKAFAPSAPFSFHIENEDLTAFKNEDFPLELTLTGQELPETVYIITDGVRHKLTSNSKNTFEYTFRKVQRPVSFHFEAAGFSSSGFDLSLVNRPSLKNFELFLNYPNYLNKHNESSNTGNITVPEGTEISWKLNTFSTEEVALLFSDRSKPVSLAQSGKDYFEYSRNINQSGNYEIVLKNPNSKNKDLFRYFINVIPDLHPKINVNSIEDTVLYNYLLLEGDIEDDYGLSQLSLFYKIKNKDKSAEPEYRSLPIKINSGQNRQRFFYSWTLDSLGLTAGDRLEYFVRVWDNDGVNGHKSSKSRVFNLEIPDDSKIEENIEKSSQNTENQIDNTLKKAEDLQKELEKLNNKIKNKKELNWQDKKLIEDVLEKHKQLKEEVEKLQLMNEDTRMKRERFSEQQQQIAEKAKQLQQLMDELLDEETQKLYDELQKLMKEKLDEEKLKDLLEELEQKDENLENELDRALEQFMRLKFDQKLEDAIKKLDKLKEEQEKLSEQTKEKGADQEKLSEEQEKLNKEFEKVKEDLKELEKINEELEHKKPLEPTENEQQEISDEMKESQEKLNNNQNKKASESQKSASEKMDALSKKLAQMQQSMSMKEMQENMEDLRYILENLISLSFDQERLMKAFRTINQSDPRFLELSQEQLKLKEDAEIVEDSLLALSKRVFEIRSFITRELNEMNSQIDESLDELKVRKPRNAAAKQQFAMTSMNNLALLLDEVLQQMQQAMANSMPGGNQNCNKPGGASGNGKDGKKGQQGLGDLQKSLNERIEQLKNSGKTGRALSEELAKLAAQQEMIRNALKELEEKMEKEGEKGKGGAGSLGDLSKKMEETEKDLVNKRLTEKTIERQQEIMTRLLEAEKAIRERDQEEKREAKTAEQKNKDIPPAFEKYIRLKEKQVELLKTISPSLSPYYRQEVNEYFQKIEN